MIALSDEVFGWDTDYQVLYDASIEAIRADPVVVCRERGPHVLGLPLAAICAGAARAAGPDPGSSRPS